MIRGLLDRIVLVVGTLLGGCVPGYIVQYRQRVGGRLDQVIADLAPFRDIARQFHEGSLDALIRHHLASSDLTFRAEGQAIQAMVAAELRLSATMQGLAGNVFDQLLYLIPHHDREILSAVWRDYVATFTLDLSGLLIALVIGVLCWLVFLGLWHGVASLVRLPRRYARRLSPKKQIE